MSSTIKRDGRELSGEAEPFPGTSNLLNVYVYEHLDDENGVRRYWFYKSDGVTITSKTLGKRPLEDVFGFKQEDAKAALDTLFAFAEAER